MSDPELWSLYQPSRCAARGHLNGHTVIPAVEGMSRTPIRDRNPEEFGGEANALTETTDLYLEIVVEQRDRKGVTVRDRFIPVHNDR